MWLIQSQIKVRGSKLLEFLLFFHLKMGLNIIQGLNNVFFLFFFIVKLRS